MAGEPEYEPVLFGGGGGDVGGQCALCGGGGARVECAACGAGARCASCDAMYHRHPKRAHHRRQIKDCDLKLPPLPARSSYVQSSAPPPLPARAISTQNLLTLRRQTLPIQKNETTLNPAGNKPRGSLSVVPVPAGAMARVPPSGRGPPALPARPQQGASVLPAQGLTRALSALVVSGSPVPPPRKNKRMQGSQNVIGPGVMHSVGPMGMGMEGVAMAGMGGAGGAAAGARWGGSCLNLHAAQQLGWFAPPPWHWPPMPPAPPPKAVERRPSTRSLAFGDWQSTKFNMNPWLANGRDAHRTRYSSEEDEEASPPLSMSSPRNLSSRSRVCSPSRPSRCGSARRSVNSNATAGYSTCSHDSRPSSAGPHDADIRINHRSRRWSSPKTMPRNKENRNNESGHGSSEENCRSKRSTPDFRRTPSAHHPSSRTSSPITGHAKRRERRHSMRTSRDWGSRNKLEIQQSYNDEMIDDRSKNEYHVQDQSFDSRKYSLKTTTDKESIIKNNLNTSRRRSCSNNRSQVHETNPDSPTSELRGRKYQLDSKRQVHDSKHFRPCSSRKSRNYSSDTESNESSDSYKQKQQTILSDSKDRKQRAEPTRPTRNPSKQKSGLTRRPSVSASHNIDSRSLRRSSPDAKTNSKNLSITRDKSRASSESRSRRKGNEGSCSGEWACRHCTFVNSGGIGGGVCSLCCRTTTPPTCDPDSHNNSSSSLSNIETSQKEDNKIHTLDYSASSQSENADRFQEKINSNDVIQTDKSNSKLEDSQILARNSGLNKGFGKKYMNDLEKPKTYDFSQSGDKSSTFQIPSNIGIQHNQSRKCDASTSPIREIDKRMAATALHDKSASSSKNLNKIIEILSTNTETSVLNPRGTSGPKYFKSDAGVLNEIQPKLFNPTETLEPKYNRTILSTSINASTMTGSFEENEVELKTNHKHVAENRNIPIRIDIGTSTEPMQHGVIPEQGYFGQLNRYASVTRNKLENPITSHNDVYVSTDQVEPGLVKLIAQPTSASANNYETTVIIPRDMEPSTELVGSGMIGMRETRPSLVRTATIPLKQAIVAPPSNDVGTSTESYEARVLVVTNVSSELSSALQTQSKVLIDSGTSMAESQSSNIGTPGLITTRPTSLLPDFSDWLQSSNSVNQSVQDNNIKFNQIEAMLNQNTAIGQNQGSNETQMTTEMIKPIELKTHSKPLNVIELKTNSNNTDNSEQWHLAEEYPQPIEQLLQRSNIQGDNDSESMEPKVNERTSMYNVNDLLISRHHVHSMPEKDSSNIYLKEKYEHQQIVISDMRSLDDPKSDSNPIEPIIKQIEVVTSKNHEQQIRNNSLNHRKDTTEDHKQQNTKYEIVFGTESLSNSKSGLNEDHSDILRINNHSSRIQDIIGSEPKENQLKSNKVLEIEKSDTLKPTITAIQDSEHALIKNTHVSREGKAYRSVQKNYNNKQHVVDHIQSARNNMITPASIQFDEQEHTLKKNNHEPQDKRKTITLSRNESLVKEQETETMSNNQYSQKTNAGNVEAQETISNTQPKPNPLNISMAVTEGNNVWKTNDLDKNTLFQSVNHPTSNQQFKIRGSVTSQEKNDVYDQHQSRLRSSSVQNPDLNNLKSDTKVNAEVEGDNKITFNNNNKDDSGQECIDAERQFQQACSDLAATERYSEGDDKDEFYLAESVQNLSDIVDNTHRLIQQMKDEISTDLTSFESADTDDMWSDDESTIASSSHESVSEISTSRESSVPTENCSTSSSVQNFNEGLREKVAQLDALCAHLPTSLNERVVLNDSLEKTDKTLLLEQMAGVNNDETVVISNQNFTNTYKGKTTLINSELSSTDTFTVLTENKTVSDNEQVISPKIDSKISTSNGDDTSKSLLIDSSFEETTTDTITTSQTNYLFVRQNSAEESMAAPIEYNNQPILDKYTKSNEANYIATDKSSHNSNSTISEQIKNFTALDSSPSSKPIISSNIISPNISIFCDENSESPLQNDSKTIDWKHPDTTNNYSTDPRSESNLNLHVASVMKKFSTKIPVSRLPIRRPTFAKQNSKQNITAKCNSAKANSSNIKNIQTKLFGEQKNLKASKNNFVIPIKDKKAAGANSLNTETELAQIESKVSGSEIQPIEITKLCKEKIQVCQYKENVNDDKSQTHDTTTTESKHNTMPLEEKSQDMAVLNNDYVQNLEAENQTVRLVQGRRVDLALAPDVRGQSPERAAAELVRGGWVEGTEVALLAVALWSRGAGAGDVNVGEALVAAHECRTEEEARAFLRRECALCAGVAPEHRTRAMLACTHRCCEDCAAQHFALVVRERSVLDASCPFCGEPNLTALSDEDRTQYLALLEGMLRTLLSQELLDLFQRKLRDYTLHTDPTFRWCHECSSGYFVGEEIEEEGRVRCPECGAGACGRCRAPWPVASARHTCLAVAEAGAGARQGTREERALVADDDAVLCPRCGRRYELARGGCMHFTCALCRYEFCGSCGEQFSVGALCPRALPACAGLGLHAHHPRNCLFYLRDKTPERLEALLREHAVPVPASAAASEGHGQDGEVTQCGVGVTREMVSGARVEGRCGGEARVAWGGWCRAHWVERLGALVRRHGLDPAPLLDVAELECVVRRAGLRPPPRPAHSAPHAPVHRHALLQIIKDKIPLK